MKRVLGLPRDRITFRGRTLAVNGDSLERRPLGVAFLDDRGRRLDVYEQRVDSRAWKILDNPVVDLPDPAPMTVPEGRYYVLGDNRDHSKDSRYWGTVARNELLGSVTRIYCSWDFNGTWAQLLDPRVWWDLLSTKTRWDRIGLTWRAPRLLTAYGPPAARSSSARLVRRSRSTASPSSVSVSHMTLWISVPAATAVSGATPKRTSASRQA